MKKAHSITLTMTSILFFGFQVNISEANDTIPSKFLQDGSSIAAIASAVSWLQSSSVQPCKNPLQFFEQEPIENKNIPDEQVVELEIVCPAYDNFEDKGIAIGFSEQNDGERTVFLPGYFEERP